MSKEIKKFLDNYAVIYLDGYFTDTIDYSDIEELISEYKDYLLSDDNPQRYKYEDRYQNIIDLLDKLWELKTTADECDPDNCVKELRDALT